MSDIIIFNILENIFRLKRLNKTKLKFFCIKKSNKNGYLIYLFPQLTFIKITSKRHWIHNFSVVFSKRKNLS